MFKKFFLLSLALTPYLAGYDATPACYRDLMQNFFSYEAVGQALSLHNIGQSQWLRTYELLKGRQGEAETLIRRKASARNPNPLDAPFQSDVARDLLKETMYQIYERALLDSGFYDTIKIRQEFEYIWVKNKFRIEHCLGPER